MGKQKSFEERVQELKDFVASNDGRLPKQTAAKGSSEEMLASFLNRTQNKIKIARSSQESEEKVIKLRQVPGMEERIQEWDSVAARRKRKADSVEALEKSSSAPAPAANEKSFDERVQDLQDCVDSNDGRLPKQTAAKGSSEEMRASFLNRTQNTIKIDPISQESEEMSTRLRKEPGMEERTQELANVSTRRKRNADSAEAVEKSSIAPALAANKEKQNTRPKKKSKPQKKDKPTPCRPDDDFVGVILEGRAVDRKNKSINGLYSQMQSAYNGNPAYEKIATGDDEGPKLYIFYASEKSRWKISPSLGDSKGGLAQCKTSISSSPADIHDARWLVFEGKDAGYKEDKLILCTQSLVSSDTNKSHGLPLTNARDIGETAVDDASSNSSSSSTSASPPPQSHNADAPPRGRVCAKILARGFLRCNCHYLYLRDCPFVFHFQDAIE